MHELSADSALAIALIQATDSSAEIPSWLTEAATVVEH